MAKKKLISIILGSTLLLSSLGILVYLEGNNANVVNQPDIPVIQAPNVVVQPQTPESDTSEEDSNKTEEEMTKEEKEKEEKENEKIKEELESVYNRGENYTNGSSNIDSMIYTTNSIDSLEERLLEHINTTNQNTISKLEQAIKPDTTLSDKITDLTNKVTEAERLAQEAKAKAEEAAKKQETAKPTVTEDSAKSKTATLKGLGITGTFTGDVVSTFPNGQGTFTRPATATQQAWTLTGEFSNGTAKEATLLLGTTEIKSNFSNGLANGSSTVTTSTYKYEGTLVNGVIEGYGVLTFQTGETYIGSFKSGKYNGYGTYKNNQGTVLLQGLFSNGFFTEKLVQE